MNPRARRLLAAGAVVSLVVGLGMSTPAWAAAAPDDLRMWGLSIEQRADDRLVTTIEAARDRLRTTVQSARATLRTTFDGIRLDIAGETAAQRLANRPTHEREGLMAVAAARSSLQTARVVYLSSVLAAFNTYAPGMTVPRALLETSSWSGIGDGAWLDPLGFRSS